MIKRKKELVEYARRLKLASLAEHMTEIIHEAQEKQPTYSEFLFSCLAKEVGERVHIPADTRSAFPVISVQSPVSIQCCWQS